MQHEMQLLQPNMQLLATYDAISYTSLIVFLKRKIEKMSIYENFRN